MQLVSSAVDDAASTAAAAIQLEGFNACRLHSIRLLAGVARDASTREATQTDHLTNSNSNSAIH